MTLQLLLLLLPLVGGERVMGVKEKGACVCSVDSELWGFPVQQYENIQQLLQSCEDSLQSLNQQVLLSSDRLPHIQSLVANVTARLQPHQYLQYKGLYSTLGLRQLSTEINQLEGHVSVVHSQLNNKHTQALTKEVEKLRQNVSQMKMTDDINLQTLKEQVRYLKNRVESCKSIPNDFRAQHEHCTKGLVKNISEAVVTKISPYGKTYISGSWGKQALQNGGEDEEQDRYWVQPLVSSHIWGNVLRVYPTYDDFMASINHKDYTFAPAHTHPNSIEGPSAVLYGKALYYHCYKSEDICRYDLANNNVKRVKLPGIGVGNNNKFPYCYYDCRTHSDIDLEADETGLWAIYATMGNHGNIVVSRLMWDSESETLNVTQTWETRVFKKAVTNAFMVCGVLYVTRYNSDYREEVFYAFDTMTGREDSTLSLPLEKVAKGVASLSYNPTDRKIYMYNDGYLLAYEARFY
ncbi:olfactomedin-like [Periophthalmus magnuspinnatus]|uniref:olfactomedin-like n=1 Tax=Periophthalmus magnuspinnatus TaxID=409849 RepID=UPI00145B4D33|nr:olfactomedin-like [Periophthalmus magnuspinnatus]